MSRLRAFSAPDLVPSDSGSITSPTRTTEHPSHEDSGLEGKIKSYSSNNLLQSFIYVVNKDRFCNKQFCDLRGKIFLKRVLASVLRNHYEREATAETRSRSQRSNLKAPR